MDRSIDIVNQLGYSKPSISVAVKNLRADGYLVMDEDKHLWAGDRAEIWERIGLCEDCFNENSFLFANKLVMTNVRQKGINGGW